MPTPLDRPRLRPGLAAARDEDDPFAVILFDQLRVSRDLVRVTAREFTWLQWLDGTHTLRDVQAAAMRDGGGVLLPLEPLTALVSRLDAALFLDGPRFAARVSGPVREPACIGCYASDPDELSTQLDGYFTAPGGPADRLDGHVMVAHDLATEPHFTKQVARLKDVLLGDRHLIGFAGHEFDPAGGAPGVPAAGVELIDLGVVLEGEDHSLAGWHVERADPVHGELGHRCAPEHVGRHNATLTARRCRGNQ
jgi:hypothetical protein